jgi:hypothetical protein
LFHDEDDTVVWRLGGAKAQGIIELLTDMSQHPVPDAIFRGDPDHLADI